MKRIIISLIIVLSLNVFGLGALNKNIAQSNEFTKEEQYLADNGHSMFAEDIRSMRLGNSETHNTTYENLIKFANDLLLSEVEALFYEKREENSFTVVTTNTLGYVPIEGFAETATKVITGITGSIREDYAPGNSNNLDIYVRYNTINGNEGQVESMMSGEPGSFAGYIWSFGITYGNHESDIASDLIERYGDRGRHQITGVDESLLNSGNIPGTNNSNYIDEAFYSTVEVLGGLRNGGYDEEVEMIMWALNVTVREVPLGIMYHERLGWTFVVIELIDRDAINEMFKGFDDIF